MLRFAIVIGLLSACGGGTKGPAWPKSADDGPDGGESIAPHKASPLASADDDDDDEITVEKPTEKPVVAAKPADAAKPAETPRPPTAPTITAPEDIINVDDLIIEIDD